MAEAGASQPAGLGVGRSEAEVLTGMYTPCMDMPLELAACVAEIKYRNA